MGEKKEACSCTLLDDIIFFFSDRNEGKKGGVLNIEIKESPAPRSLPLRGKTAEEKRDYSAGMLILLKMIKRIRGKKKKKKRRLA